MAWEIRRRILSGEIAEGHYLPQEAELVKQFGVSRPTLREAIRILESQDLVSISQGRRTGAIVRHPNLDQVSLHAALLFQVRRVTLREIIEAWQLIEPRVVGSLATSRPDRLLAGLHELLDTESQMVTAGADTFELSHQFHLLLVHANENSVLGSFLSVLRRIIEAHFAQARNSLSHVNIETGLADSAHGVHRDLVRALEDADAAAAEDVWRGHIRSAGEKLIAEFGADELVALAPD